MTEKIDPDNPNAGLFGADEEDISFEEYVQKELYGKNGERVAAFGDLCYEELIKEIDDMDVPEDEKRRLIFNMTAHSLLDFIFNADEELGLETADYFDMSVGIMLTNKKYKVDLLKEHFNGLMTVDRKDFPDDEEYKKALERFDDQWWLLPQPLLGKRTPNDAITETLAKYGLN